MKKLFFATICAILILPVFCSAQSFGVKLSTPKNIVMQPAKIITADSIYIQEIREHEWGLHVVYAIYMNKEIQLDGISINLWGGDPLKTPGYLPYDPNHDYTRQEIKARIKQLLTQ